MFQSHVIDVSGVFAGAAVRTARNYRFVAVHPSLTDLHHLEFQSLSDIHRTIARRMHGVVQSQDGRG